MKKPASNLKLLTRMHLVVLMLFVIFTYGNTLQNKYVWDDKGFSQWPLPRTFSNIGWAIRGLLPEEHNGDYRPIKTILMMVDYKIWGKDPLGYHLQAIGIHLITTILIYFIAVELTKEKTIGLLTGILFAVHPLHTEAITFITSSTDMPGPLFLFASFYAFLKPWHLSAIILYILAVVGYEMTIVGPVLFFFTDLIWYRMPRWVLVQRLKTVYLPYVVVICGYIVFRLFFFEFRSGTWHGYPENNLFLTFITAVKVYGIYIKTHLLPWPLSLNHFVSDGVHAFYTSDGKPAAFLAQKITDRAFLISLSFFTSWLGLGIFLIKKAPVILFSFMWFVLSLAVVSNIYPIGVFMQERYTYMASFAFCFLMGSLLYQISRWGKIFYYVAMGFGVGMIGSFATMTVVRNTHWKDPMSLWSITVAQTPESSLANFNLATAYEDKNDFEMALAHYHIANDHNYGKFARFPLYLAELYAKMKDTEKAYVYYEEATKLANSNFEKYYATARMLQIRGIETGAIENYKRAIVANPMIINPHLNVGAIYSKQGKYDRAELEFKAVKSIDPTFVQAYTNLAYIYNQTKRIDLAIAEIEVALRLDPRNANIKSALDELKAAKKNNKVSI